MMLRGRRAWAAVVVAVVAGSVVVLGRLQASAGTVDPKAWYVLWARHGGDNQQWRFIDVGDGHYRLQNRHSGKVLDDRAWSRSAGADIVQWSDLNRGNQQFRVAESPDGYVRLINRFSGMAVEVHGGSRADGGKVVQYWDWGGANQQWQLVPAGRVGAPATTGGTASPAPSSARPSTPASGGAMAAVAAMQPGWNLGNALDAVGSDETAWGNPRITKTLLDNRTKVLDRYRALWTQIAATLRNESPKLTFESVNEPLFTDAANAQVAQSPHLLKELNTSFHRIVRQSGGTNATRLLVLPTLNTSADQGPVNDLVATFKQLNDPDLIATCTSTATGRSVRTTPGQSCSTSNQ